MEPAPLPDAGTEVDVQELADRFVAIFPALESEGRTVAVTLYRLLARGEPVTPAGLARAAGVEPARVTALLDSWPGVYREDGRVIGFWGLTPRPFSNHRLRVAGRDLYAWCAWDALFLPQILGRPAAVESADAHTGEPVRLRVTPEGIRDAAPPGTVISMLEPREDMVADVVARLCHYIHFFAAAESGRAWRAQHPGTLLLSLEEAFLLGRIKNERRFGEALRAPAS